MGLGSVAAIYVLPPMRNVELAYVYPRSESVGIRRRQLMKYS